MAFPARFNSTCSKCSQPINKGQYITWSRRERGKASHLDCGNFDAVPEKKESSAVTGMTPDEVQAAIVAALSKLVPGYVPPVTLETPCRHCLLIGTHGVGCPAVVKAKKVVKDSAAWYDLLAAICLGFDGQLIRVMLIGPPGTGKSKTSLLLTDTPYRVTMTEGMGVEDLIGMYQLIKGETVWCDGPVVRAMKEGKRILIDEVDHHPTEIGSLLYALLDDSPSLMLPTGESIAAKDGYGVIATTNSNVTALPEAVLDRFEAVLPAILPHPDALMQFDNQPMKDAVSNHFQNLEKSPWNWSGKPTLRRMRAFGRLKDVVGELNAANLAFGTAGKELLGVLTTASRKVA